MQASARAGEAYVAQIEYLTEDEWATELGVMCKAIAAAQDAFRRQHADADG